MNAEDIRRALLKQRRIFNTQAELAGALGVSNQALSQFLSRKGIAPRGDCQILRAMGLHTERVTQTVIEPDEKL